LTPPQDDPTHAAQSQEQALPSWLRPWERFWFTPADPIVLAMIRIVSGMVIVYMLAVYSLNLPEMMGDHAWVDLPTRLQWALEKPVPDIPLTGKVTAPLPPPANDFQKTYKREYKEFFKDDPPPPYPANEEEARYLTAFRVTYRIDLRVYGLPPPKTDKEREYVAEYMQGWSPQQSRLPPPAYAKDAAEAKAVDEYRRRYGIDPRLLYDRGHYVFSLWFAVTDPDAQAAVHGFIVAMAFLFLIGFCTRLTAALTWFGSLCYIHRSPTILFGADTMMNILLLYLMIAPSGAALSVDRWIARWWSGAKPGMLRRWFAFWRRPMASGEEIAPSAFSVQIQPSVSANIATRLLQIHLCMIYLFAGLAKLLGPSWWNGTALWGVLANFEMAPMRFRAYTSFLGWLGSNPLYYGLFVTLGTFFTLVFEITYPFLIWRPSLRWFFLGSAILLHGLIGLMMELGTFALLMLAMNMIFLRKEEAYWLLSWLGVPRK
jgi:hypothetical protein